MRSRTIAPVAVLLVILAAPAALAQQVSQKNSSQETFGQKIRDVEEVNWQQQQVQQDPQQQYDQAPDKRNGIALDDSFGIAIAHGTPVLTYTLRWSPGN